MKRILSTVVMAMMLLMSFAQMPQTFSYQAVLRDAENNLVVSKPIVMELSILQGSDDGEVVYFEKHIVSTNSNGLISLEMGAGVSKDDFSAIDWSNAPYFVKTVAEFDGKTITGITPLLAVPYALYAEKAGNAEVDLSGYYSKEEVDALLAALESKIENGGGGNDGGFSPQGNVAVENGAIMAAFSISDSKQIYFSQGNLQYQASTGTWRFAEHQYDMIGSDNSNISSSYSGWIDLFGWGTSGYNGKNPYMTISSYSYYADGSNDIAGTNYDWGVYNKISNGGNQAGMWRTLTYSEWNYLITNRTDARYLRGTATVNGMNGLILLPDNWTLPTGVTFTYGEDGWQNTYSASEWSKMEANCAVFLPAAGDRYGTDVYRVGSDGYYWSSSAYGYYGSDAGYLHFGGDYVGTSHSYGVSTDDYGRCGGQSVRLVQDVE